MPFTVKLVILIVLLVAIVLVPYFFWHEQMDAYFASPEYRQWLVDARPYAWLIALALLASDCFLPVPATPIMATMGALYGPVLGGAIAAAGSVLAGLVAFGVGRLLGKRALLLLAGEKDLADMQRFFDTWGAAGVVASRALPVAPEVLAVLAGLARMHLGRFVLALVLGGVPIGAVMAWAGSRAAHSSTLVLVLTLIPAALWCASLLVMRKGRRDTDAR